MAADTLDLDGIPAAPVAACSRCGRPLRHPDSVSARIGPKCADKQAAEWTRDGRPFDRTETVDPSPRFL